MFMPQQWIFQIIPFSIKMLYLKLFLSILGVIRVGSFLLQTFSKVYWMEDIFIGMAHFSSFHKMHTILFFLHDSKWLWTPVAVQCLQEWSRYSHTKYPWAAFQNFSFIGSFSFCIPRLFFFFLLSFFFFLLLFLPSVSLSLTPQHHVNLERENWRVPLVLYVK